MKPMHLLLLASVAVGGFLAWKYRAKILPTIAPDPTVQTVAGNSYGAAQDVPGTIAGAISGSPTASAAAGSTYDPATSSPALNAALTGALGPVSYAGGMAA